MSALQRMESRSSQLLTDQLLKRRNKTKLGSVSTKKSLTTNPSANRLTESVEPGGSDGDHFESIQ